MMLSSRDVENCEDTPAIMEEKGETKKRGRTYRVAGAPNDVWYKNNTLTPGISMRYLPKYVPALKASNTYHWSNQRKMTNTFSKKMATLRACSPTGHDCSTESVRLTFRKRRMVSVILLFIPRAWDVHSTLLSWQRGFKFFIAAL